jgi:non-homologous end joining protein Ku
VADRGTRATRISFGAYAISVSMKKAQHSRDLKTKIVDAVTFVPRAASGGVTRRGPGPGEVRVIEGTKVVLPPEDLARIEQDSKGRYEAMTVLECIDYRQVPTERIVGAYWLQPRDGTAHGLRVLYDALRAEKKVAIVQWVATNREKLGVIRPRLTRHGRALLLSELSFADDFSAPDDDALSINDVAQPTDGEVDAACKLVRAFAREDGTVNVDTATDSAVNARLELAERLASADLGASLRASVGEGAVEPIPASSP